jgi:hypothetical protein
MQLLFFRADGFGVFPGLRVFGGRSNFIQQVSGFVGQARLEQNLGIQQANGQVTRIVSQPGERGLAGKA